MTELKVHGFVVILNCSNNQLSELDLGRYYSDLVDLDCSNNQLTKLNVSGCVGLDQLDCSDNRLSELDVESCENLKQLDCSENKLKELDVSKNSNLRNLTCTGNRMKKLDVSKNLYTLEVIADSRVEVVRTTEEDSIGVSVDEMHFPDEVFRAYVQAECDLDGNGILSAKEIGWVKSIDLSAGYNDSKIYDLTGVEFFTALESLECQLNKLTKLDLSANTVLTSVKCQCNELTELDVSGCPKLAYLDARTNHLTELDLSGCAPEISYEVGRDVTVIGPVGK